MQITIQLDSESARQLVEIQNQTDRDHNTILRAGIALYHQQILQSDRLQHQQSELDALGIMRVGQI